MLESSSRTASGAGGALGCSAGNTCPVRPLTAASLHVQFGLSSSEVDIEGDPSCETSVYQPSDAPARVTLIPLGVAEKLAWDHGRRLMAAFLAVGPAAEPIQSLPWPCLQSLCVVSQESDRWPTPAASHSEGFGHRCIPGNSENAPQSITGIRRHAANITCSAGLAPSGGVNGRLSHDHQDPVKRR